jgi:hypothetical protein
VSPRPSERSGVAKTFHEEDDAMHLIAADTAFELAREHRQRLLDEFPRRPRRTRRLRRRPVVDHLPGSPPDAA